MQNNYLKDQRGVAMLLELVLIAAVLGLVGMALYQSSQNASTKTSVAQQQQQPAAANSTVGLANSAAAIIETESAADMELSDSAEASAGQLLEADADVTNLGGSSETF
jgi:uncharacterized protein HemX